MIGSASFSTNLALLPRIFILFNPPLMPVWKRVFPNQKKWDRTAGFCNFLSAWWYSNDNGNESGRKWQKIYSLLSNLFPLFYLFKSEFNFERYVLHNLLETSHWFHVLRSFISWRKMSMTAGSLEMPAWKRNWLAEPDDEKKLRGRSPSEFFCPISCSLIFCRLPNEAILKNISSDHLALSKWEAIFTVVQA